MSILKTVGLILLAFGILPIGILAIFSVTGNPQIAYWAKYVSVVVILLVFATTSERIFSSIKGCVSWPDRHSSTG